MQEGLEPREFKDFLMGWEQRSADLILSREWRELKLIVTGSDSPNAEEVTNVMLKTFVDSDGYLDGNKWKFK